MTTLIDSIIEGLSTATRCSTSEVPPAAVLWTDAKSEWLPLADTLRQRLPNLLIYGDYDAEKRTGPAIWLKCAMEGALDEPTALAAGTGDVGETDGPEASAYGSRPEASAYGSRPEASAYGSRPEASAYGSRPEASAYGSRPEASAYGSRPEASAYGSRPEASAYGSRPEASAYGSRERLTPIIYLPGVSRQDLRAGSQCPRPLQPIVELLYRGAVWTQKNGRDWTVEALLVAKDRPGLALDVAGDKGTRLSMMASLSVLADTPVSRLQGRRLEAEDFDKLMIGDHPRDLLRWMSDPDAVREEMDDGRWHAFCNRCRDEYGFDPESEGALVAGEKFGLQQTSSWEGLWGRFRESPSSYQTLGELLQRAKPSDRFDYDRESWPDENAKDEAEVRKALSSLSDASAGSARAEIAKLEKQHGVRRAWVWAQLGKAPLAGALAHLIDLANRTAAYLGGDSVEDLEKQYVQEGFLADDAALRALASVKTAADSQAVEAAVRALYLPWVEQAAEKLQELVAAQPLPTAASSNRPALVHAEVGCCLLFADGLRYDLAQRLSQLLAARGLLVEEQRRWAALPSVTATAKPAISPVAEKVTGVGMPDSFLPELVSDPGKPLTFARLQSALKAEGYQIIPTGEVGEPAQRQARAWCEFGDIDKRGHSLQIKLASIVEQQVELLADRVDELLEAGWRQVRLVTDHGWLLMPGGLPKEDLPRYLTEAKWSRCATIKGDSNPSVPRFPWYWNPQAEFASAPGIRCFSAGHFYQHGGVSLQECLIADLTVTPSALPAREEASITKADWKGLKCRISVDPAASNFRVDLRSKPNDPGSSVAGGGKPLDGSDTVTLFVEDEDLEGAVVAVVVCNDAGQVIAKQNTTIGGE